MMADAHTLLVVGGRRRLIAVRRTAPEQLAAAGVALLTVGWAIRVAVGDLLQSLPAARVGQSLSSVVVVAGLLATATVLSSSMTVSPAAVAFAHRLDRRGVLLARTVSAGTVAAGVVAALTVLLGAGTALGAGQALMLATIHLPVGLALGAGTAAGAEMAARALVRSRAGLAAARLSTLLSGLGLAVVVIVRPTSAGALAVVAAATWLGVMVVGGPAPVRPQWLTRARSARTATTTGLGVAAHPVWHPLSLLARDALALPTTVALVLVIAAAAAVVRLPQADQLGQLYVAAWPLLVIVPASALGLVAFAKSTAIGGGLYGHRLGPAVVARRALGAAAVSAVAATTASALLASVAGGAWMSPQQIVRFVVLAVICTCVAQTVVAVRPVRAGVVDLPATVSLAHVAVAGVVVGAAGALGLPWLVGAAVAAVAVALALTTATAYARNPFTR